MRLTGIPRASHAPRMARVKQQFAGPMLQDIPAAVRQTLGSLALPIRPGQSVALAVGSRGIVNMDVIAKAAVEHVKALGAKPFIFPAMGSHGGGTAEGQRSVLEHYGITEATMGCPVRATMDVVQLGEALGLPVWLDRYAAEADWIGLLNRVKPHTDFVGEIESGLFKMMTIGVGKHRGAVQAHRAAVRHRYEPMVVAFGREVLRKARIAFGLGIVENGYDETALVRAFLPGRPGSRRAGAPAERQELDGAAAVRADRPPDRGRDGQGHLRLGDGLEHHRPPRDLLRAPVHEPQGHVHRGLGPDRAHLRQRDRHRERRLHDPPARRQDRLGGDVRERAHRLLPGRLQDAGDARLGPGGHPDRALVPRTRPGRGRAGGADQEHAEDRRGGRLGEPAPGGRQAGRPLAGRRSQPRSPSTRPATSCRSDRGQALDFQSRGSDPAFDFRRRKSKSGPDPVSGRSGPRGSSP